MHRWTTVGRFCVSLALMATVGAAWAADPIRAYVLPDGRIRLWLHGAPTVTASPAAGWKIEPAGKDKDKTWLDRLKKVAPAGGASPWKALLDALAKGNKPTGVELLQPKASVSIEPATGGAVALRAADEAGKETTVEFTRNAGALTSVDAGAVERFLDSVLGSKQLQLEAALSRSAGLAPDSQVNPDRVMSAYIASAIHAGKSATPILLDTDSGPAVISVHVAEAQAAPTTVATGANDAPGGQGEEPAAIKPSGANNDEWWPIPVAGVAGLALGFGARSLIRPRRAANSPRRDAADLTAKLAQREEDLARAKAALDQTKAAAREYKDQHSTWLKERDETLRALADERAAHKKAREEADKAVTELRKSEDEARRTKQELGRQVESLQRVTQKSQSDAQKARSYADLERELAEAFNYMQSEIGRPEISAAVGYLLTYSCANLLEAVSNPNPMLERAMLANIKRIGAQFPNTPHARKLVGTAQKLGDSLGSGAIPDSQTAHAHARHFDEVLRYLRNQRGLELSPFYFGVDKLGAVHAVYV